ncbi:NAD-dependent epimerase/dehydratase family protein [Dyadobacter sediminis]|uniref:NAD-dependent epimerase/dehydratase family protein n=1 Tax=Dyadobacter sediminis TaxID=1493691 RepID=A0A5R9KIQ5_9BACT|nr:NAD-dependent epimerase/dehydratase family protein [Dyadobacter sediminis]TLU96101.1 NAD-dependent epimerase/dehydratase family protein [Dyadobacter sediminis]GGB79243.1 NAD-dependent dehydratase [Dyadobacter sediminis]
MQTILGAGGATGIVLAKELRAYTQQIRLVSRKPVRVNADDELFPTDLLNAREVENAVAGSSVVYLTAGLEYNSKVWKRDWPILIQNVIDACLKAKARLVFLDNVYMYAASEIPSMTEQSAVNPPSEKGKVRAQVQDKLLGAIQENGLQALIARSADFYGPDVQNSPLNISVTDEFRKGKKAFWQVDASKVHSFTYVPDIGKSLALLGNTPDAFGEIWHLPTSSEKWTGKDFIEMIASEMNLKPRFYIFTRWMMQLLGLFVPILKELKEMAYQYDRDYFFDSSKFEKRFSYKPMSYAEGIRQTFKNQ